MRTGKAGRTLRGAIISAAILAASVACVGREVLAAAQACRNIAEVDDVLAAFRSRGPARSLLDPELITVGSDSTRASRCSNSSLSASIAGK